MEGIRCQIHCEERSWKSMVDSAVKHVHYFAGRLNVICVIELVHNVELGPTYVQRQDATAQIAHIKLECTSNITAIFLFLKELAMPLADRWCARSINWKTLPAVWHQNHLMIWSSVLQTRAASLNLLHIVLVCNHGFFPLCRWPFLQCM